eukprot:6475208-Amphidinium_carterae.1
MLAKQAGCDLRYSTNRRMSSVVSAGQRRARCSKIAAVSPSRSPQTTESYALAISTKINEVDSCRE